MHPDLEALIRAGSVSPAARVPPFSSYDAYAPYFGPCRTHFSEDVLRSSQKRNGGSNFNAACYIRAYRNAQRDALAAIQHRPGDYVKSRWEPLAEHFFHDLGPGLGPFRQNGVIHALGDVYQPALVSVSFDIDERGWAHPLFPHTKPYPVPVSLVLVLATLFVLVKGGISLAQLHRHERTPELVTWAYVGIGVACVTSASVLTEFGENSRFRVLVDPIVLGVVAAEVCTTVRWLMAHVGAAKRADQPTLVRTAAFSDALVPDARDD